MRRRELLKCALASALVAPPLLRRFARASQLPAEVAGVRIPQTPRALAAAAYARTSCPAFLFNHSMRTYLFGALQLRGAQHEYRAEDAFISAAFHDLGLLPAFETPKGSFETDGADAAERWALSHEGSAVEADRIWHAVQMHDGPWALTRRQGSEARLVALGAGIDVYGPDPGELEPRALEEVLAAFPRLDFKRQFTALLSAHCERKPNSQRATWLEGLCRAHAAPAPDDDAVAKHIAAAAFEE
ncbi:MAG TPA: hypothetical protein VEH54_07045 [Steroidobacteraceae bacterium]|nr:hypothetical protein [Steroidobacteraceae bacterium]